MDHTERRRRAEIAKIPDGEYFAEGFLDDDGRNRGQTLPVKVCVRIRGDSAEIDLTGSSPQVPAAFNVSFDGSTKVAAFFVFRAMPLDSYTATDDIPANEGSFRPISVIAPKGCIFNPIAPAAAEGFAEGAARAAEAGFDGVEIHGASGYLLYQFIHPRTNLRRDAHGGSVENNVRFARLVCEKVREAIGPDKLITLRLSQDGVDDFTGAWPGGVAYARELGAALADCAVDARHWSRLDWTDNRDPASEVPMPKAVAEAGAGQAAVVGRPLFAHPKLAACHPLGRALSMGRVRPKTRDQFLHRLPGKLPQRQANPELGPRPDAAAQALARGRAAWPLRRPVRRIAAIPVSGGTSASVVHWSPERRL